MTIQQLICPAEVKQLFRHGKHFICLEIQHFVCPQQQYNKTEENNGGTKKYLLHSGFPKHDNCKITTFERNLTPFGDGLVDGRTPGPRTLLPRRPGPLGPRYPGSRPDFGKSRESMDVVFMSLLAHRLGLCVCFHNKVGALLRDYFLCAPSQAD